MKKVYLDNAATTPMLPQVIDVMMETMTNVFGNPSSTHAYGRNAKALVENARKNIAKSLNCTTSELVFTSGGTEAINLILKNAINHIGVKHIITSKIEHHAVLYTIQNLEKKGVLISYIDILEDGSINLDHLEQVLEKTKVKTLISLMHVNNEIGNILDLKRVIELKRKYDVLFHTDTVQSIGHFNINLKKLDIDFLTASAHKFHGPKGIGFAFFRKGTAIQPEILGGEQERGTRAGTENIASIVGMQTALSKCLHHLNTDLDYLKEIKEYFILELTNKIPSVKFNGVSNQLEKSSHTILNVLFPKNLSMLLFQLDLKGIAVSGGSACQSGSHKGSHVLQAFLNNDDQEKTSVRFSFSSFNTKEDIDYTIETLKNLI